MSRTGIAPRDFASLRTQLGTLSASNRTPHNLHPETLLLPQTLKPICHFQTMAQMLLLLAKLLPLETPCEHHLPKTPETNYYSIRVSQSRLSISRSLWLSTIEANKYLHFGRSIDCSYKLKAVIRGLLIKKIHYKEAIKIMF